MSGVSRRSVLAGTGGLVLGFSLGTPALAQEPQGAGRPAAPPLPGSLKESPLLDSWIRVDAEGGVTVFTGKAELGQGMRTAVLQIAAEELDVPFASLRLVTADTDLTPNEGFTAGSNSIHNSGLAIRHAAAQVRAILVGEASQRLGIPSEALSVAKGVVLAADGRSATYGELVAAELLHVEAQPRSRLKDPARFKVMGHPVQRVDIPAKVTGGAAYVQDLRLPGMVHARIIRPPGPGAKLTALDAGPVEAMPGVVKVVRDGDFLAVVATREFQAIKAMRALQLAARWEEAPRLPKQADIHGVLTGLPATDLTLRDADTSPGPGMRTLAAAFTRPYQMHGSIGPSCAVAELRDGRFTVWTHTQGVYPDRKAIAEMLGVPQEAVRCIHAEGSGCYGHNGADDVAADAALIARALPGRPVRVQWTREQEHAWEPYGPGMVTRVRASLDASGQIAAWDYGVWSNPHSTRPGTAGSLLAARHLATPFALQVPKPSITPEGSGDRNAIPLYQLPRTRVVNHYLRDMPLRVSALRSLGAYMNVFSIESFMDELAAGAGADPVEFRLRHLDEPRGRAVIATAAERFGWSREPLPRGRGRGFGFAQYKNLASYLAIACEAEVEPETGRVRVVRAVAAIDSGEVVNPDGIRNQTEGGILQSISWTLYEQVAFDETGIKSVDWSSYPILRFGAVPDSVEVHVIPRPGAPFLGAGEAAQGPTAAAVANAVAHATGKRLRDLPLTRERVKAAMGVGA